MNNKQISQWEVITGRTETPDYLDGVSTLVLIAIVVVILL